MQQKEYITKLETLIKQMIKPIKGIPLTLVIESISGYKIIPFNKSDIRDKKVLESLKIVAKNVGQAINIKGIIRSRPNEVGNDIETFVKKVLDKINYKAKTPSTTTGKKKSTGYPDIEFIDEFKRINYLECKTFNIENISTTQRSFYLSPSEEFKITTNAHHFILSFEIFVKGRKKNQYIYNTKSWKILSIEKLEVDVKYEFNADNAKLYSKELILAEGQL
ncbi:MAG: restriction endonuclease [Candidatus Komeilibacteria bacterium]|nr:restriction endonuclease [Candidatus Komeilibacteria bacterium]